MRWVKRFAYRVAVHESGPVQVFGRRQRWTILAATPVARIIAVFVRPALGGVATSVMGRHPKTSKGGNRGREAANRAARSSYGDLSAARKSQGQVAHSLPDVDVLPRPRVVVKSREKSRVLH